MGEGWGDGEDKTKESVAEIDEGFQEGGELLDESQNVRGGGGVGKEIKERQKEKRVL